MATGFTAPIENDISFEDFVKRCARAFGATIHMKEEGLEVELREDEYSSFYEDYIKKAKSGLEEISKLTTKQCESIADEEYEKSCREYYEKLKENKDLIEKYKKMLVKVEMWRPPTADHVALKTFMIQQIKESINNDDISGCIKKPIRKTGAEWKNKNIQNLKSDVEYYTKRKKEEEAQIKDRNEWIKKLKESLEK